VLAVNLDDKKENLGLELSESANLWQSVPTDLTNRGVDDVLIASVDKLTGFPEAIATIYPDIEAQQCILHQVRKSLKYGAQETEGIHGRPETRLAGHLQENCGAGLR